MEKIINLPLSIDELRLINALCFRQWAETDARPEVRGIAKDIHDKIEAVAYVLTVIPPVPEIRPLPGGSAA